IASIGASARMKNSKNSASSESESRTGRGGGRAGRASRAHAAGFRQKPFRQPRRRFSPIDAVSVDELEAIHQASLTILEEVGMDFLDPDARQLLKAAGANVARSGERVRFDRNLVLEKIKTAPGEFSLHARNPDHNLCFSGDQLIFAQVASAPNSSDLDRGRR